MDRYYIPAHSDYYGPSLSSAGPGQSSNTIDDPQNQRAYIKVGVDYKWSQNINMMTYSFRKKYTLAGTYIIRATLFPSLLVSEDNGNIAKKAIFVTQKDEVDVSKIESCAASYKFGGSCLIQMNIKILPNVIIDSFEIQLSTRISSADTRLRVQIVDTSLSTIFIGSNINSYDVNRLMTSTYSEQNRVISYFSIKFQI
jgi:hypothetical protein